MTTEYVTEHTRWIYQRLSKRQLWAALMRRELRGQGIQDHEEIPESALRDAAYQIALEAEHAARFYDPERTPQPPTRRRG